MQMTYTEKETKSFEEVSLGDVANDYFGHDYPVIDKGNLRYLFEKWGHRTNLGLQDFIDHDETRPINEDTLAIAVLDQPHPLGDVVVYIYGPEGAEVYKNPEEIKVLTVARLSDFPEYTQIKEYLEEIDDQVTEEEGEGFYEGPYSVERVSEILEENTEFLSPDTREEVFIAIKTLIRKCKQKGIQMLIIKDNPEMPW